MRVAELDEVSYDLEVDGEEVRRTVGRRVFEGRGWATVVVAYQERKPPADWGGAKLALVRLKRARGAWAVQARVTLGGADAVQLADALEEWRPILGDLADDHEGDDDHDDDHDDD
jgi:hypothetical protein